uniref:CUB domain-containing protein n=1 Tax=Steinernema glaseri TaxID=37863 RepID=A0A1I7Y0L3_9BILA
MLSRVLTIVALLVLTSSSAATLSFVECPKNSTASHIVSVPSNGSIGLRSYDWPNSMTDYVGRARFGKCGFQIESASKQKLGLFFTNAHVLLAQDGGDSQAFDTNDQEYDYVQAISSDDGELSFDVQNVSGNYKFTHRWTGLEAIVGAYDDESTCPFVTGENTVTVLEDEPRVAASHWDFSTNSTNIPPQSCLWRFAPKPGYTLKIVFPVFSISEAVALLEDKTTLFPTESGKELPSRVFYTDKNFTLAYARGSRMSGPDASRFVAVISSFPAQAVPARNGVCSGNKTLTLTETLWLRNVHQRENDFFLPYENNQECSWKLNTIPGKLLQFSLANHDVENFCESLTLRTPSTSADLMHKKSYDLTPVYTTNGSEVAEIHWKSDGDYVRSGFSVMADYLDCSCSSPGTIALTKTNKTASISPAADGGYYCPSMHCHWNISSPPNTMLVLEPRGGLRACLSASKDFNDTVVISDGTTSYTLTYDNDGPSQFTFFGKSVSVEFTSSAKAVEFVYEKGIYSIGLSYADMSTLKDKNNVTTISSSSQHTYFNTQDLKQQFSSVTYTLSEELKGKKLQLYTLQLVWSSSSGNIIVIDGDLSSPVTVAFLTTLISSAHFSGFAAPFTSTTGRITIMYLDEYYYNSFGPNGGYDLFFKVYDDSRDCDEKKAVYYVRQSPGYDEYAVYIADSSSLHLCPLTIISQRYLSLNDLNLHVNSLEGTDKNVSVLPGSDFSATPFFEFNQKNQDKWSNTKLSGKIFTVLVPVGGRLNFTARFTEISNTTYADISPPNGIFMSPNYPYGDDSVTYMGRKLVISSSSSKKFKVDFDVFVGELSSSSSLLVYTDKASVMFNPQKQVFECISHP